MDLFRWDKRPKGKMEMFDEGKKATTIGRISHSRAYQNTFKGNDKNFAK